MPAHSTRQALPPRMEASFATLLRGLAATGHQAPQLLKRQGLPPWCRPSLFLFLGYVAKAEGRVLEQDIRFAESLIKSLGLSRHQRRKAIRYFQKGKAATRLPPLSGLTLRLSQRIWPAPALLVAVCLCHAAQLKGRPAKPRRYRCEDSIDQIGLPMTVSDDLFDSYATQVWGQLTNVPPKPLNLEQACTLLGVTRRDTVTTIKRAYRKKVSQCHPDKLAQQQLSEAEHALAKERLLVYQQAWELIRRHY